MSKPTVATGKQGEFAVMLSLNPLFADLGADIVTNSPAEFGKFVQSEYARWGKFIKDAKITAD